MITINMTAEQVMNLLKLIEVSQSLMEARRRELNREVVRYNEWELLFKKLSEQLELTKQANEKLFTELLTQYKDENG